MTLKISLYHIASFRLPYFSSIPTSKTFRPLSGTTRRRYRADVIEKLITLGVTSGRIERNRRWFPTHLWRQFPIFNFSILPSPQNSQAWGKHYRRIEPIFFLRKPQIVNFRLSRDFGSTGNTAFSKIFARRKEQTFAKVAERMLIWSTLCESHTSLLTTGSSMASMVKNQEFLERIRKSPWENYPKKALRNSKVNISAIGSRHYWRKTHPNLWSTTSFKWPGAWGK